VPPDPRPINDLQDRVAGSLATGRAAYVLLAAIIAAWWRATRQGHCRSDGRRSSRCSKRSYDRGQHTPDRTCRACVGTRTSWQASDRIAVHDTRTLVIGSPTLWDRSRA